MFSAVLPYYGIINNTIKLFDNIQTADWPLVDY